MPDRPVVVVILKGSFVFAADLIRELGQFEQNPEIDFISVSSYGSGTTSSGSLNLIRDLSQDVEGRTVLIVDDILDSGRTLAFVRNELETRGALRVLTCALLDKPSRRVVEINADFAGFEVDDVFVFGYGMDLDQRFRELPFIGTMASARRCHE